MSKARSSHPRSAVVEHFDSLDQPARLRPFLPPAKAAQLVSSLRLAAVAFREEHSHLIIDTPSAVADLCTEMRFLSHESLRVILLNTKRQLIKVVTVSQGTLNEALSHPREIFKPVIVFSAHAFILVHNHPSGDASPSEADLRLTRRTIEASRILQLNLIDHVIIGTPAPGRSDYFSFKEGGPDPVRSGSRG